MPNGRKSEEEKQVGVLDNICYIVYYVYFVYYVDIISLSVERLGICTNHIRHPGEPRPARSNRSIVRAFTTLVVGSLVIFEIICGISKILLVNYDSIRRCGTK